MAQREAEQDNKERQKQAISKALLFEVDDFYTQHLKGVYDYYRNFDGSMEKLPGVIGADLRLFAVYEGNTPVLGNLPDEVVKSVVNFYDMSRFDLLMVQDYKDLLRDFQYGTHSPEAGQEARQVFSYVRASIPKLTRLSDEACKRLADLTHVSFQKDTVSVAGEDTERLARDEGAESGQHRGFPSQI